MDNGLAGKTLRINLTTGEIKTLPTDEELFRRWHGGRGVIAKIFSSFM
jgi:aldehyde:ferredoxin oxidoreductase